jgi:hypothetical protein
MAMHTIYAAATAATNGTSVPHPVFDAGSYEWIVVSADNLGEGEEIDIYVLSGTTFIVATDSDGVAYKLAGTAATANAKALQLAGGLCYQFRKDLTAGACGIYVNTGPGMNS